MPGIIHPHFRIKGIVQFSSGPEVVNAIFRRADYAPVPVDQEATQTTIICIGYNISAIIDQIDQLLSSAVV